MIHNPEAIRVAVGCNADLRACLLHFRLAVAQQMIVRLRSMPAKQHIAIIVHRRRFHAVLPQNVAAIAPRRAPEGVEDHLDPGLFYRRKIHQLRQALEVIGFYVDPLELLLDLRSGRNTVPQGNNLCLNLLGNLGKRRSSIRRRKFDPVVLRRIMRCRKVDRPVRLQPAYCIGDRRRRRGRGDHDRRDTVRGQQLRRLGHKHLPQEARVAPYQNPVRPRLLGHIPCDASHRPPNIRQSKLVGDNRPPP